MTGMRNPTAVDSEVQLRGIWDAHQEAVASYCRRRTSVDNARDAVAETFSIAWRKLDEVPEGLSARYWLYAVAGRVLSNQRRRDGRRALFLERFRATPKETQPSAEAVVMRRAEEQQVIEAANRLSRTDREILLLAAWEELPHAAIGEVLGVSPGVVAQRLTRARKRLTKEFNQLSGREDAVA